MVEDKFTKGNPIYLLYSERRKDSTQAIGFFGRATNIIQNSLNQEFNVGGYELTIPAIDVCFDDYLITEKKEMPHVVIPRARTTSPYVILPKGMTEETQQVDYARTLDDFLVLLRTRNFNPSVNLYKDMTCAIRSLRLKK